MEGVRILNEISPMSAGVWFDGKYCQRCEAEKTTYVDSSRELDFAYCELHDNCRFFDCKINNRKTIKMWLDLDCEEN